MNKNLYFDPYVYFAHGIKFERERETMDNIGKKTWKVWTSNYDTFEEAERQAKFISQREKEDVAIYEKTHVVRFPVPDFPVEPVQESTDK